MSQSPIQKILPFLWYAKEAEEAARFYARCFPIPAWTAWRL